MKNNYIYDSKLSFGSILSRVTRARVAQWVR